MYQVILWSKVPLFKTNERMERILENKENMNELDPSKAWIRNIGPGSTRGYPKNYFTRNGCVIEVKPISPTKKTQQRKVRQRLAEFYQSKANEMAQTSQQNCTVQKLSNTAAMSISNARQLFSEIEASDGDGTENTESTTQSPQIKIKPNLTESQQITTDEITQTAEQNCTVIELDDSDPKLIVNMDGTENIDCMASVRTAQNKTKPNLTRSQTTATNVITQRNCTIIELDDSDPKLSVDTSQSLPVKETVIVDETIDVTEPSLFIETAVDESAFHSCAEDDTIIGTLVISGVEPLEETEFGTTVKPSNDQTVNKTVIIRTEPTKPPKALPCMFVSTDISDIFDQTSLSSAENTVMPLSSTLASTTCIRMENVAKELRKIHISNGMWTFF